MPAANQLRVAIIQSAVPHYRRDYYERLLQESSINYTVFCQPTFPAANLDLIHRELGCDYVEVAFVGRGNRLVWQWLPLRNLWSGYDVYVFYGNPRVFSNVLWATLFRLLGKPIVIHGPARSFRAYSPTERLRLLWWRCFRHFLVYTDQEADFLLTHGFAGRDVVGMNNGLNQEAIEQAAIGWQSDRLNQWQITEGTNGRKVILSVARLVDKNRFDLVLSSLPALLLEHPNLLWCVIGDGPLRRQLQDEANRLGVSDHVRMLGQIYNEDDLAPWFLSSEILVHPSAIGLSLLHAFGYGLPVVTHDNTRRHGPEIAAFQNRVNGLMYRENSVISFTQCVSELLSDESLRKRMGEAGLNATRHAYNTQVMAERFTKITWNAYNYSIN